MPSAAPQKSKRPSPAGADPAEKSSSFLDQFKKKDKLIPGNQASWKNRQSLEPDQHKPRIPRASERNPLQNQIGGRGSRANLQYDNLKPHRPEQTALSRKGNSQGDLLEEEVLPQGKAGKSYLDGFYNTAGSNRSKSKHHKLIIESTDQSPYVNKYPRKLSDESEEDEGLSPAHNRTNILDKFKLKMKTPTTGLELGRGILGGEPEQPKTRAAKNNFSETMPAGRMAKDRSVSQSTKYLRAASPREGGYQKLKPWTTKNNPEVRRNVTGRLGAVHGHIHDIDPPRHNVQKGMSLIDEFAIKHSPARELAAARLNQEIYGRQEAHHMNPATQPIHGPKHGVPHTPNNYSHQQAHRGQQGNLRRSNYSRTSLKTEKPREPYGGRYDQERSPYGHQQQLRGEPHHRVDGQYYPDNGQARKRYEDFDRNSPYGRSPYRQKIDSRNSYEKSSPSESYRQKEDIVLKNPIKEDYQPPRRRKSSKDISRDIHPQSREPHRPTIRSSIRSPYYKEDLTHPRMQDHIPPAKNPRRSKSRERREDRHPATNHHPSRPPQDHKKKGSPKSSEEESVRAPRRPVIKQKTAGHQTSPRPDPNEGLPKDLAKKIACLEEDNKRNLQEQKYHKNKALFNRFVISLEVERLTRVLKNLDETIEKKSARNKNLSDKNKKLQEIVDKFMKETPALEEDYKGLKANYKNLAKKNAYLDEEIFKLQKQNKDLFMRNQQLEISLKNETVRENLEGSVNLLKNTLKSANEELSKLNQSAKELHRDKENLKKEIKELKVMNNELVNTNSQLMDKNTVLLNQNSKLTGQNNTLMTKNSELAQQMEEITNECQDLTNKLSELNYKANNYNKEIETKDQELEMLRDMVRDMQETEISFKRNSQSYGEGSIQRSNSSQNLTFLINFLNDLYIILAGVFRACDMSSEKSKAKKLFDKLNELKDDELRLRADFSDAYKRELRKDHQTVHDGLKGIKKTISSSYHKKRRHRNSSMMKRLSMDPSDSQITQSRENFFDSDEDYKDKKKYKTKFEMLEKKFEDLQNDYKLLKQNRDILQQQKQKPPQDTPSNLPPKITNNTSSVRFSESLSNRPQGQQQSSNNVNLASFTNHNLPPYDVQMMQPPAQSNMGVSAQGFSNSGLGTPVNMNQSGLPSNLSAVSPVQGIGVQSIRPSEQIVNSTYIMRKSDSNHLKDTFGMKLTSPANVYQIDQKLVHPQERSPQANVQVGGSRYVHQVLDDARNTQIMRSSFGMPQQNSPYRMSAGQTSKQSVIASNSSSKPMKVSSITSQSHILPPGVTASNEWSQQQIKSPVMTQAHQIVVPQQQAFRQKSSHTQYVGQPKTLAQINARMSYQHQHQAHQKQQRAAQMRNSNDKPNPRHRQTGHVMVPTVQPVVIPRRSNDQHQHNAIIRSSGSRRKEAQMISPQRADYSAIVKNNLQHHPPQSPHNQRGAVAKQPRNSIQKAPLNNNQPQSNNYASSSNSRRTSMDMQSQSRRRSSGAENPLLQQQLMQKQAKAAVPINVNPNAHKAALQKYSNVSPIKEKTLSSDRIFTSDGLPIKNFTTDGKTYTTDRNLSSSKKDVVVKVPPTVAEIAPQTSQLDMWKKALNDSREMSPQQLSPTPPVGGKVALLRGSREARGSLEQNLVDV